jgi:hypothetical protein
LADDRADASSDLRPGWIADFIRAARLDDGAVPLTDGMLAALDLPGSVGHVDPYRPWFMDGEPGGPWWAAEGLWG